MKIMNYAIPLIIFVFVISGCSKVEKEKQEPETTTEQIQEPRTVHQPKISQEEEKPATTKSEQKVEKIKVTFIELGSVKCIPCKMMQPIMKEIEEEYGNKGVKVIFYDVWTEEGRPYAEEYNIRVIPTQVFLDENGKEYFRHEGFFPKDELVKVLNNGGVK